jgi:hypothetical protein
MASLSDQFKFFIEKRTGSEWDWWPLNQPFMPKSEEQAALQWKCVCVPTLWAFGNDVIANVPYSVAEMFKSYRYQKDLLEVYHDSFIA